MSNTKKKVSKGKSLPEMNPLSTCCNAPVSSIKTPDGLKSICTSCKNNCTVH